VNVAWIMLGASVCEDCQIHPLNSTNVLPK
jgi:hypothetical protein